MTEDKIKQEFEVDGELLTFKSWVEDGYHYEGWWDSEGRPHHPYTPAYIKRNNDPYVDNDYEEIWYWHGVEHCVDGPAYSSPNRQVYSLFGKFHRVDGPAYYEEYTDWKGWSECSIKYAVDGVIMDKPQFDTWREWYESDPDNVNLPWSWSLSLLGII